MSVITEKYCPFVPVSIGEIMDKLSILYIKRDQVQCLQKRADIIFEISQLEPIVSCFISQYSSHWKCLMWINRKIWDANEHRTTISDREAVKELIVDIMIDNDARFRIKSRLNQLTSSQVIEHKSYANKISLIKTDALNKEIVGAITYHSLHCDTLYVICPNDLNDQINRVKLDNNTIVLSQQEFDTLEIPKYKIIEKTVDIPLAYGDDLHFMFKDVLYYALGGKLGDFMHFLYVVYCNFIKTGKKGVVYLHNDGLSNPLRTFNDLSDIIPSQKYIERFERYNDQRVDVLCTCLGLYPLLNSHWLDLIVKRFGEGNIVKGAWLEIEPSIAIKEEYSEITVVHNAHYYSPIFPWKEILTSRKCIFVTCDRGDYDEFFYKDLVELKICKDLKEISQIIAASKRFIAGQSSPLAFACAMNKLCVAELFSPVWYAGIEEYNSNFSWMAMRDGQTSKSFTV